ncbi:bifunctional diguanylate cyclase/phosphodiesterase [Picosynechococcus sp. NKBG042902]|uniref:putative bifunctional diguanylate cyclase/phosphodiesterase n=1 Tax=Picosynechococcus sp. NKBG042902 TaxID=490193 RepID=UPI0004AA5C50|nr:EAL domain-containing protein [Picosynechococcus sp. NKBG042902]
MVASSLSPTILVIEDEDSIRELIVTLLIAEDYQVLEAENGQIGVGLAIENCPDLIICDIMMPGMDGYSVLEVLQADPETETIPFIFLTAKGTKENIRQGMNLGADDYLTKPFTTYELLDAIKTRLRKHRSWQGYFQQKKQAGDRQQINYAVTHDPITQLPNQLALRDDLNRLLKQWEPFVQQQLQPHESWQIPIFYLSVDRFEKINELFGYQFGNAVLKHIVRQLVTVVAEEAYLACLNYTDFVVIYPPNCAVHEAELNQMAEQILEAFSSPLTVNGQKILINWYIGMITMPYREYNFDKYLNQAKEAMETARQRGSTNYYFHFQEAQINANHQNLLLDADLYDAIQNNQLTLYYQPKISTTTGKIVGAEALIRWFHPTLGMVSPAKFIPLAEKNGLIASIGEWVFRAACHQAQQWMQRGMSDLRIAVNLSGRQFYQAQLVENLVEITQQYGINPAQIELEVTESILISDVELAIAHLQALKNSGFPIAIDDFGTGYSSLSYLQNFPFDILKIDRCFVRNVAHNITNSTIVKHIIMMAKQLELTTVAEGVETMAELEFLKTQHCDEIQGFLFSPPVPAEKFTAMLQADQNFYEPCPISPNPA